MKQKIQHTFYLFLVFQLWCFHVAAQLYPVQVNPVLLPPYTLNTNDYFNSRTEKLAIVLSNTDLQKPVLGIRLRMFIEGQNAKLQSKEGVYYPTINLEAGIPLRISLTDLAPYFNADHLNFQGITRAMYVKDGKLPEGFYQFCFEAVEVTTGQVVSRKSCSMAWITLNDPPFLNLPIKGESVASREVQNLIFQWTPRNMGSPNGAFNTEYEFTLKELWDSGIAPEAAFNSTQPLYQTTVKQTTLLMGPAEPLLIPGKRYAWQVRALSTSPTGEQTDNYRNNGFSEIFWFTYQSNCKAPMGINASINAGRATISWQSDMIAGIPEGGYTVQYREHTLAGNNTWYSVNTLQPRIMLYDLKPGTTYDYRIGSQCDATGIGMAGAGATYSDILTLSINGKPDENKTINCGTISPEITIANKTSITSLSPGDIITAGDFPVKLTEVTGGGSFSGQGYVTIPMLGYVNVKVRFTNIGVNTEKQLYSGVVETTYDSREGQIGDLDKEIEGGAGTGIVFTGKDTADYTVKFPINSVDDIKVELKDKDGNAIAEGSTTPAAGADIKVSSPGGKTETISVDKIPSTIKDSEGTVYEVSQDKDGKPVVSKLSENVPMKMSPAELNTLAVHQGDVRFVPYQEKQIYAFDEYKAIYSKSLLFGGAYEKIGDNYYVNAKAILPGKTDYVKAVVKLNDHKLVADSVQFVTAKGNKLEGKKLSDGSYEIPIVGGPANDAQELYAVYPQDNGKYLSLGKLLIVSYEPKTYKVQLVPVIVQGKVQPEIDVKGISEKLNKVYGPIGINFVVSKAAGFANESWDLDGDQQLAVKGSNWLSNQTAEMKALNKAYKAAKPGLEKDMLTLFVLNSADSTGSVLGDMPRGTAFGYLFNGADGTTAAHEIGHGIFKLKHTFDGFGYQQGQMAGNLMDYPAGDKLTKFQWDGVHAPGIVVDIFEKDEDAMEQVGNAYQLERATTFLSPANKIFTLPAKSKIWFYCLDYPQFVNGAVYGFTLPGGDSYQFNKSDIQGRQFNGYYKLVSKGLINSLYPNTSTNKVGIQKVVYVHNQVLNQATGKSEYWFIEADLDVQANQINVKYLNGGTSDFTYKADISAVIAKVERAGNCGVNVKPQEVGGTGKYLAKISFDQVAKKWKVEVKLDARSTRNGKVTQSAVAFEKQMSDLATEKVNELGGPNSARSKIITEATEDGDGFYVKNMDGAGWVKTICDLGSNVWENAALPEGYWNKDSKDYKESPLYLPPTLAGVSDGAIDLVSDYPKLIKLGYDVATKEEFRQQLWDGVKNITPSKVWDMADQAVKGKLNKYINSPSFITNHEFGYDGVGVVKMITAGGLVAGIKDASQKFGKGAIENINDLFVYINKNRSNIRKVLDTDVAKDYARKYFNNIAIDGNFEEWYSKTFKVYNLNEGLNFEVHHVIPIKVLEKNPKLQEILLWAEKNDKHFDFNSIDNGIPLQKKSLHYEIPGHANHPKYDDAMTQKLLNITESSLSQEKKFESIKALVNKTKNKLESEVLLGTKDVNDIIEL